MLKYFPYLMLALLCVLVVVPTAAQTDQPLGGSDDGAPESPPLVIQKLVRDDSLGHRLAITVGEDHWVVKENSRTEVPMGRSLQLSWCAPRDMSFKLQPVHVHILKCSGDHGSGDEAPDHVGFQGLYLYSNCPKGPHKGNFWTMWMPGQITDWLWLPDNVGKSLRQKVPQDSRLDRKFLAYHKGQLSESDEKAMDCFRTWHRDPVTLISSESSANLVGYVFDDPSVSEVPCQEFIFWLQARRPKASWVPFHVKSPPVGNELHIACSMFDENGNMDMVRFYLVRTQ